MKNILVATYGTTWYLILELLGFTNPDDFHLYANHPEKTLIDSFRNDYGILPIDEIWLVTTSSDNALEAFRTYQQWHIEHLPRIGLHIVFCDELNEIRTIEDCSAIRDLIFRTVLAAHTHAKGGQVTLSMIGGYKTLSADIQEAGNIFGCHALLHILINTPRPPKFERADFDTPLSKETAATIMPVVVSGKKEMAAFLYNSEFGNISMKSYPIVFDAPTPRSTDLVNALTELRRNAGVVLSNFTQTENTKTSIGNFRSLSLLHPRIIEALKNSHIGSDITILDEDLKWLYPVPKAELHCHFGGILSPSEMIDVANSEHDNVEKLAKENTDFAHWLAQIRENVIYGKEDELGEMLEQDRKEALRTPFANIPEPYPICGFLSQFEDKPHLLDKLIFSQFSRPDLFVGVGIKRYEHLGDLQGSALMQSENCLRAACRKLIEKCMRNNILYMEVRCSPVNYTRGGLSGEAVVKIMLEELSKADKTFFAFLFIASRHGRMSDIYRHIELVEELFENKYNWTTELFSLFKERFVGFDLAGAENSRSPKQLREAFETLHKRCLNLTIHAGETADAESIWEAVYYLNADRIGHGLTLGKQPELLNRFIEHRIAIEMCPSSNFQICGFKDCQYPHLNIQQAYPLQNYMQKGVRVTINTDDPGISRTDLTHEFLKAACMTPGGISKWDILQLIYNSFSASFAHFDKRREILNHAENEIINQIKEQYGTR